MKKKMKIILESAKGSELGWDHIPPFVMDLFYCFFSFSFFFFSLLWALLPNQAASFPR